MIKRTILVKTLNPEETIIIVTTGEQITDKISFQGKSAQANAEMFVYYYSKEKAIFQSDIIFEGV